MSKSSLGAVAENDNPAMSDADKFKAAYASYKTSYGALWQHEGAVLADDATDDENKAHEAITGRLCANHSAAIREFMLTIAPDEQALKVKIRIFSREYTIEENWPDAPLFMAAIAHDAERLL